MKQMRLAVSLLFLALNTAGSHPQSQSDSTLNNVFLENSFAIETLEDTGANCDAFFLERIRASQFTLIGEQHGIQEIGHLTNYIFELARTAGYNYLAIETDSLAANYVERFAQEMTDSLTIQKALAVHDRFPFAIPFYYNHNNYSLFRHLVHGTENGDIPTLWGVDQVYFLEYTFTFSHLLQEAGPKAQALLHDVIQACESGTREAFQAGNLMVLEFFKFDEQAYQELRDLYSDDIKNRRLLDLLWASRALNEMMFTGQTYDMSLLRAKIMKQNFTSYYKQALTSGTLPKAVLKMGYDHLGKGLNGTGVYDIGSFISELAQFNGLRSFHIKAIGLNGVDSHSGPFSPATANEFNAFEKLPEEVQVFIDLNPVKSKYLVSDLEAFRHLDTQFSPPFEELFHRNDALILITDCRAIDEFRFSHATKE